MKLLNRTVRNYLLYSVLLVLFCTPLFYFSIEQLFVQEIDKALQAHKKDFIGSLSYLKSEEDLKLFHLMNDEFLFRRVDDASFKDTLFTDDTYDSSLASVLPYRVLKTSVVIHGHPYEILIRESMVSHQGLISAIMSIQFLMLTLMLVGLMLINRKLSSTIWRPFYKILDSLKKYQIEKDQVLELPHSPTAEFRELSTAITQLVKNNHDAYLSQKEFTENASHELQTPLAICRTKLELLAQTKELTSEQADLVESLLEATDRISRLNKDLLLLSKIENLQFFETEEIELRNVIQKSLDHYKRQAEEKHLVIQSAYHQPTTVKGNPVLLDVLINNVVSNAIRHAPPSGTVIIENNSNCLIISNSGPELEQPEKLFNRFHRESRASLGSGLGLSIIKKITDVSGYQITYIYQLGMHQFIITFHSRPVA